MTYTLNLSKLLKDEANNMYDKQDHVHEQDSDCAMFLVDGICTECGVWHGDPCPQCGGRGFHALDCPEVLGDEEPVP